MNKEDARKKLEKERIKIQEQRKLHEQVEEVFEKAQKKNSKISGPRNDLEYQKMLNDMKESDDDK